MDESRLEEIEELSRELDTNPEEIKYWMLKTQNESIAFLESIGEITAFKDEIAVPSFLSNEPNEDSIPIDKVVDDFMKCVNSGGLNPGSGRFFGYVPGGGLVSAAVGDFLAALTNRYSGVFMAGPGAAAMENQTILWLKDIVGLPKSAHGTLQSGGTLSTLTAIVAARETRPPEKWETSVIYVSSECHNAFIKSLKVAGLAHVPLRFVGVDASFRINLNHLKALVAADRELGLNPWIVAASAGTVNTGAVDPLEDIHAYCKENEIWFHVDGAYGGFFALADHPKSEQLKGMALADSLVLDPHKGLFLPYGCGAVLVKDANLLKKAFQFGADYLEDVISDEHSPADFSPELTRHFRAARLWMSIKLHGMKRFRAALTEKLVLADYAYEQLSEIQNIEMGPPPQLSCVTFRVGGASDEKTKLLLNKILGDGHIHLSSTRLDKKLFLRMCILCFRSHKFEIDLAIDEIERNI